MLNDGLQDKMFPECPVRNVLARVTARAESFLEACRPMIEWVMAHFAEIMTSRKRYRGE